MPLRRCSRYSLEDARGDGFSPLPNVGLQLFDVVTVTDARAEVSSEVYRVRGIEETYDTTKDPLVYGQRVGLGGK